MFLAAGNHIIYNIKEDETISQHYKHRGTETQSFIVLCVSASLFKNILSGYSEDLNS